MDPFEVRMQFLDHLRKLTASQQYIQKVVTYALKYFSRCGDDLWDCVIEECQKGSLNTRINILHFLDSLCETSLLTKANAHTSNAFYVDFVARDLGTIVECVVPDGREGLPNVMSTMQILENWRSKRIIDPQKVDDIMLKLKSRKASLTEEKNTDSMDTDAGSTTNPPSGSLSRNEIFQRIEEDRERHKRLRERRWVQPVSHNTNAHLAASQLASFMPETDANNGSTESTLDIEFDNDWEATSDWNSDDDEAINAENLLCYPDPIGRLASVT